MSERSDAQAPLSGLEREFKKRSSNDGSIS